MPRMNSKLAYLRHTAVGCVATMLLVGMSGCAKEPFPCAPVSGVVTLDGKPLGMARVIFSPKQVGESAIVGPTSFCLTDDQGHYELATTTGKPGAMVGSHTVYICGEVRDEENPDVILVKEYLPKRYYEGTELSYDVTSWGTSEANFELSSK
ncbi:hypothetical protein GCM10023155_38300 [Bremerella cremea]